MLPSFRNITDRWSVNPAGFAQAGLYLTSFNNKEE